MLALLVSLVCRMIYGKPVKMQHRGVAYVFYPKWRCGVSLGCYVLLGDYSMDCIEIKDHEWGHTRQSLLLGPLYLLLIGIPSGLGNLYDRWFHTPERGWSHEESYLWYYSQPWEKWADKLGGVKRPWEE